MTTTTPRTAPPDRYFRLPEGIRPALYNARLDIYVDDRRFSGQVDIEINASEPIGETLRLHADRLQADRIDLNGAPVNNWELEPDSETLRIDRMFHAFCTDCHRRERAAGSKSGPIDHCTGCHGSS